MTGKYIHPVYGTIEIDQIEKNMFSFKYYDFLETIKDNQDLDFMAFVDHFQAPDQLDFKFLNNENGKIDRIELRILYPEPLQFIKTFVD